MPKKVKEGQNGGRGQHQQIKKSTFQNMDFLRLGIFSFFPYVKLQPGATSFDASNCHQESHLSEKLVVWFDLRID